MTKLIPAKFTAAFAAIALIGTAGIANAEEFQSNGRSVEVRHGDLDLSKPAHQKTLRRRIAYAVNRVCTAPDLSSRMRCRSETLANVDAPVAAAIARADTGERYADAGTGARGRSAK